MAGHFLSSRRFLDNRNLTRRAFRRLAGTPVEADLASYLLFDGPFASELIELGRADAKRQQQRLLETFSAALESRDSGASAA